MKNIEVVISFLKHSPANQGVGTDGDQLLHDGNLLARWRDNKVVIMNHKRGKELNKTRSRLANLLRTVAELKEIEIIEQN